MARHQAHRTVIVRSGDRLLALPVESVRGAVSATVTRSGRAVSDRWRIDTVVDLREEPADPVGLCVVVRAGESNVLVVPDALLGLGTIGADGALALDRPLPTAPLNDAATLLSPEALAMPAAQKRAA